MIDATNNNISQVRPYFGNPTTIKSAGFYVRDGVIEPIDKNAEAVNELGINVLEAIKGKILSLYV